MSGICGCAGDGIEVDDGIQLEASGPIRCEDPAARERAGPLGAPEAIGAAPPAPSLSPALRGAAIADFDGDGALDVLLVAPGDAALYLAEGAGWRVEPLGIGGSPVAAIAVDLDDDGDLDAAVADRGGESQILWNDGGALAAEPLPVETPGAVGVAAGDVDGDGILDLLFAGYAEGLEVGGEGSAGGAPGAPSVLLLGAGGGAFIDASGALSDAAQSGYTFVAALMDADADGDLDIYLVNDFGPDWIPNLLLENSSAGELSLEVSPEPGISAALCGMGLGIGELNGDGIPDLLLSDWGGLALLESGPGGWADAAAARGLTASGDRQVSWGADWVDADDDGDLDASVGFGFLDWAGEREDNPLSQPDGLWLQGADGAFTQAAEGWEIDDEGATRGVIWGDVDGDGALDRLSLPTDGPASLRRGRCGEAGWLEIALEQPAPNVGAVGARIEIVAGGATQTRWILAGGHGLGVGWGPGARFGLGDADAVDVTITWPDGQKSSAFGLEPHQRVLIRRRSR